MDPMLIGLAAGAGKSMLFDAPKAERQRQLAAQTAMYSPWTGMAPEKVNEADLFGSSLQGVTAGAMYGQNKEQNEQNKELLEIQKGQMEAQRKMLEAQAGMYGRGGGSGMMYSGNPWGSPWGQGMGA